MAAASPDVPVTETIHTHFALVLDGLHIGSLSECGAPFLFLGTKTWNCICTRDLSSSVLCGVNKTEPNKPTGAAKQPEPMSNHPDMELKHVGSTWTTGPDSSPWKKGPMQARILLQDMNDLLVSLFTDMSKTTEVVYKNKQTNKQNIRLIRELLLVTLTRHSLEIRLQIFGMLRWY